MMESENNVITTTPNVEIPAIIQNILNRANIDIGIILYFTISMAKKTNSHSFSYWQN